MSKQVIRLSRRFLDALTAFDTLSSEDRLTFRLRPLPTADASLAVFTSLERFGCATAVSPDLADFVLVLTSGEELDSAFRPVPLPGDVAERILAQFHGVITDADSGLSAHDLLELAVAFDAAAGVTWKTWSRLPGTDYERRIVRFALRSENTLGVSLAVLDQRHAPYREVAIRTGMVTAIRRLATEGPIADTIRFDPEHGPEGETLVAHEKSNILRLMEQSERLRTALASGYSRKANRGDYTRLEVTPFWIQELCHDLVTEAVAPCGRFAWRRTHEEAFFGASPIILPADLEPALLAYCQAFDRLLLAEVHPVIRASLAWYEFMRIQPFNHGNDRVGWTIFCALLDTDDYFSLPMSLLLYRHRYGLDDLMEQSVKIDNPAYFVQRLVDICIAAITVGEQMLALIGEEKREMLETLSAAGIDPAIAEDAAAALTSSLLVEEKDLLLREGFDEFVIISHLNAAEHILPLKVGERPYWSSQSMQRLVSSWTVTTTV